MSKLVFKAEEVKGIMEHVVNTNEAKLMLVKDEGVYLLSPGYQLEDKNVIAYSVGFNPSINEDWYDVAHAQLGGDDFADNLDAEFAEQVLKQIEAGNETITIIITANSIKLAKGKIKPALTQVPSETELPPNEEIKSETTETNDSTNEQQSESQSQDNQPQDNQPQDNQDQSPIETKVKPGQAIREKFIELVAEGKITDDIVKVLVDKDATAKATSVRYAFLKEYDPNVSIKELTYINGAARYTSKPIVEINGKQYLITNDFYAKTLPKFMAWVETLK